jgi:group I intron endonuclease
MNKLESKSCVYAIRNKNDGKVYVGSAKNITQRRYTHLQQLANGKHHSVKLQRAWDKYGKEIFELVVLEQVSNVELLVPTEQRWIDALNAYGPDGYNMIPFAGTNLGLVHSAEAKEKIAAKATGRIASMETRAKMSASSHRVRPMMSSEQKEKIAETLRGRKASPETREKQAAIRRGKPLSPETCAKMSISMRGKNTGKRTDEQRAKMSESLKGNTRCLGYKHTPETRAKVSAAGMGRVFSAERNAAISEKLKGRKHTAEHVAKGVAARWGISTTVIDGRYVRCR